MQRQVVLVVGLGRIERFQRFDGGRDRFAKSVSVVDLRDVVARNLRLVSGDRKDSRTILCRVLARFYGDGSKLPLLHAAPGLKVRATPFMQ